MPEKISNTPKAKNFMETARSFGNYDLALALADIIDNSITAGAKNIYIEANFDTDKISISDDGHGMTREELIVAMRIGSKNPKEKRSDEDLGRFGLGLKTASFSQADKLTVLTNKDGNFCGAEWDLNDCDDFNMTLYSADEAIAMVDSSVATKNGTEVVWSELSRLRKGSKAQEEQEDFNRAVKNAADEIGLIFHRFLAETESQKDNIIKIFLNGLAVEPVDPFCQSNPKTQRLSQNSETIGKVPVTFTPFTLPFFSQLKPKEKEKLGGNEGFVKNSGFYIYRNKRLIIRGTWFQLVPHGELSKLSRIMVDIPNSIDEQWKITVDKSGVQLPGVLRKRLSSWLKNRVVPSSVKVFKHLGKKENSGEALWYYGKQQGIGKFILAAEHPILHNFSNKLEKPQAQEFKEILGVIQSLLPVENIRNMVSDQPEVIYQGYTDKVPAYILEKAVEIAGGMLDKGRTKSDILISLSMMQPFNEFYTDIEQHFEKKRIFKG